MILSSHIIVSSALSTLFESDSLSALGYFKIFAISFLSHYFLDLIPHWDYQLVSIKKFPPDDNGYEKEEIDATPQTVFSDFKKNMLDGLVGLAGAFFILGFPDDYKKIFLIFIIVSAGILPDILEVCYLIFKKFPLSATHRFHKFIHGKKIFLNRAFFGVLFQIISVLIIIFLIFAIKKILKK